MIIGYPETLIINTWSSQCGSCGKGCSPDDETHERILGYGVPDGTKGCGVRWTKVASEYVGAGMEERIRDMRPDLEFVDLYEKDEVHQ